MLPTIVILFTSYPENALTEIGILFAGCASLQIGLNMSYVPPCFSKRLLYSITIPLFRTCPISSVAFLISCCIPTDHVSEEACNRVEFKELRCGRNHRYQRPRTKVTSNCVVCCMPSASFPRILDVSAMLLDPSRFHEQMGQRRR